MKNIIKSGVTVLLLFAAINLYGQTTPEKVNIDSKDHYRHGYNAASPNTTVASEAVDSVTVSSTLKYFVLPDPGYNAGWYNNGNLPADVTGTTGLSSSFVWTIETVSGGAGSTSSTTQVAPVNWTNPGTAKVKVQETPQNAACTGNETVIDVEIIAKPTVTFGAGPGAVQYVDGKCYTQTEVNNKITYNFPALVTSAVKAPQKAKISYTVTKDGTAMTGLAGNDVDVVGGVFPVEFTDYGSYVVTITKLTDRISRKSGVESTTDLLTSGGSATFTYNILRPAQTGSIYRLPNAGNY